VIWHSFFFAGATYFTWWDLRLLYVAGTRQYVMALTRPFTDTVETAQTRVGNPQRFWANVVAALALLPIAAGGLYLSAVELYAAVRG
jgi:hypothetical protein